MKTRRQRRCLQASLAFLTLLGGPLSFAQSLTCLVSNQGANRQTIQAQIVGGLGFPESPQFIYRGHTVSAQLHTGSAYEAQQLLTLKLDNATSQVYSPGRNSLYKLSIKDGTELQCYLK